MNFRTLANRKIFPALWILIYCSVLPACAQTSDQAELNREAEKLLRSAAEALANKSYEVTLENARKVATLLPKDPRVQQRAAELIYLSGHAKESIPLFDLANELAPNRAAENWQRGIALATAGDFKRGAEQFKLHREVNPNDVENSAWFYLCVARSEGLDAAKRSVIPSGGDSRQPMMNILNMLDGKETPEQVTAIAEKVGPSAEQNKLARFYADLYIGLYYDSAERTEDALKYFKRSLAHGINGYMADTARVYLKTRFKNAEDTDSNGQRK